MPRDEGPKTDDAEEKQPRYTGPIPKSLGGCADRLFALRALKADARSKLKALEAEESALKEHVVRELPKGDTGAAGKLARVTTYIADVPQVSDWDAFWGWVRKGKGVERFGFLQRRLSVEPIAEMWEHGKDVPGVIVFRNVKVSVNKL